MGRGRAPCCDKTKVRTGPWSPAEDLRLMNFIQHHGHSNWRALPKQAGLLRCGKSCRLRWINYLRPDVKRGNFTPEEENTIIQLHNSIGNKWSKIASCLPGRTDNEIKNVWNTHLKKRQLKKSSTSGSTTAAAADHENSHKSKLDSSTTENVEKFEEEMNSCIDSPSSSASCLSNLSNSPNSKEAAAALDLDGDFWEMLDSLDPPLLQAAGECDDVVNLNHHHHDLCNNNINVEGKVQVEVEVGRWLQLLENELGLANDGDHLPKHQDHITIQPADFNTAMSPSHHYLGI